MNDLLNTRGRSYGEAWKLTGRMVKPVATEAFNLVQEESEIWAPWMLILNKLVRILTTPKCEDHWRDIAGYATLVFESLTKKEDK